MYPVLYLPFLLSTRLPLLQPMPGSFANKIKLAVLFAMVLYSQHRVLQNPYKGITTESEVIDMKRGNCRNGLDTDILIRYLTQDDPIQSPKATEILERRFTRESPGFVSPFFISLVTMAETVWVLGSV